MRLLLGFVLLAGCGRFAFDASVQADSGTADTSSDAPAAPSLAIEQPPADAQVIGLANLTGSCADGAMIALTGDLVSPPTAPCASGMFAVDVTFTAGTGDKYITLTQGSDSVTRHFVRIAQTVAYRASTTGTTASLGSNVDCTLSIARPAGTVTGDVMIGTIYTDGSTTSSIDTTGWTRLSLSSGAYVGFFRIAGSAEPTSYSFPITAGPSAGDTCESGGVVSAYSGVDVLSPVDVESATNANLTTTISAPSVTATTTGMLVGLFGSNGPASGITLPSGMTSDAQAASPGDWGTAALAHETIAAGVTGTRMATIGQARDMAVALVVLVP